MVYHGDPSIPQPHDIPPATLQELADGKTDPPTPEAEKLIRELAHRHPQWDARRIHARIRADTNRHDVSIAQVASVLLAMRGDGAATDGASAQSRAADTPLE
ncbi:helix-turn-helix domain-containing protein [Actinoplanes sp. NPDC026619]|uniref:helix-turn-helix domain-containing protein n=1 Tax=Actinoplanes sp. NPDC026619 TaxID=3155798 RepID=UPI0033CF2673